MTCATALQARRRDVSFLAMVAPIVDKLALVTNTPRSLSRRRTWLAPHGKPHRFSPRFLVDGTDGAHTCFVVIIGGVTGTTSPQIIAWLAQAMPGDVATFLA